MTSTSLFRLAALAAVVAGALFAGIQFIHPDDDVATVTTGAWALVAALTFVMALAGLVGVTGLYLRQVERSGLLGLIGYALLALFFLLTCAFTFVETLILPVLADEAPEFVGNVLGLFNGDGTDGSLGALELLGPTSGVLYLAGGVLFGVAAFRAGVTARWAGLLLAVGAVLPVLTGFLPHAVARFAALPVGMALVGLGLSLWTAASTRQSRTPPVAATS
ncbi:hypothetical protein [Georgenia deserti]|uniref:DUF4386 family protein n=1 Tax=Georgenia deserti TaxID=2093781 RepID=A0ABW4L229_9MICO